LTVLRDSTPTEQLETGPAAVRHLSRRAAIHLAVGGAVAVAATAGGVTLHRSRHVEVPLLCETVAVRAPGVLDHVPTSTPPGLVVPGTRVFQDAVEFEALVQGQRAWLSGGAPWTHRAGQWANLLETASLDLHVLALAGPAVVAGWPSYWRYVWPRDASHAAVALARSGRADEAQSVLAFLAGVQDPSGWFEARYLPDGSGPPDGRKRQLDGTGWVLWASAEVAEHLPAASGRALATSLRPLIDRSLDLIQTQTSSATGLPSPSPDYWEVDEDTLTLGTAAPLAAGLWGAGRLLALAGDAAASQRAFSAEQRLRSAIDEGFAPRRYPRHLGSDNPDAAVAFLLPPYAASVRPAVLAALVSAEPRMGRANGGLAPGSSWKQDGIAWTPETAQFALAHALCGQTEDAARLLTWLAEHRTSHGSLPEKVLHNGAPAGPAPLSWTAALVMLAIEALTRSSAAKLSA
jgi:hypothetical protein